MSLSASVTTDDLLANPNYPFVAHVPVERLSLDPANLPEQRRRPDGTPVCLAGDHAVNGGALLCTPCRNTSRNLSQQRRREARLPHVRISKTTLNNVHDRIDSLSPLMMDLTVAYNNNGNLRAEMNRVMLEFKKLQREVKTLLPDTRSE